VTDYQDWGVPQANASMIAATGVPLLGAPNLLLNDAPVINAGGTYFPAALPVSQVGYEISLQPFASGSGSQNSIKVIFTWLDVTGNFPIAIETWYIWPGNTTAAHYIYGKGPTKGSILQVSIINGSSAMQYTVPIQIWQRSHPYTRDDWRSRIYIGTTASIPIATNDLTSSLIGYRSAFLATAASDTTELPLYSGPCVLWYQTSSGAADMVLTIQSSANPNGPGVGLKFYQSFSDVTGVLVQEVVLPRYQCRVVMKNNNAASATCIYSLFTVEQSA
jgi:hypothetical protein